jgi:hypothetical protein
MNVCKELDVVLCSSNDAELVDDSGQVHVQDHGPSLATAAASPPHETRIAGEPPRPPSSQPSPLPDLQRAAEAAARAWTGSPRALLALRPRLHRPTTPSSAPLHPHHAAPHPQSVKKKIKNKTFTFYIVNKVLGMDMAPARERERGGG